MLISTHFDADLGLLVSRHGEEFVGAEGQLTLLDFAERIGRLPQYWILDVREVVSASFKDSDTANVSTTDRMLSSINGRGAYRLTLAAIVPPGEAHPIYQRLKKMEKTTQTMLARNKANRVVMVRHWREALETCGLPDSVRQPY